MAEAKGNNAVPHEGDHDRVAMLSLNADGTPDQHNPEIIGEREFAEAATREQFRQQAVSAVDQQERGVSADLGGAEVLEQDPAIAELQKKHEAAEKAAEKAADATVGALYAEPDATKVSTPATSGGKPAPTSNSTK